MRESRWILLVCLPTDLQTFFVEISRVVVVVVAKPSLFVAVAVAVEEDHQFPVSVSLFPTFFCPENSRVQIEVQNRTAQQCAQKPILSNPSKEKKEGRICCAITFS
ncbi:hypothetical protein BKA64DRAFT_688064 [Cadophora sp. MPI-SDFR-AT-0126]|nr:hypothetical protein BKA64DRAFT_688064 [Leotiomycetes sp. MPI-SDFR-AT-0126]